MKKKYRIIGLMSGTSLDGLDIVDCSFFYKNNEWSFFIHSTDTHPYPKALKHQLKTGTELSARKLLLLDKELGLFFAKKINQFIIKNNIHKNEIDAIASHGHTIFHQPELGYTYQIGCGETIAFHTKIKVINDFRQKDVVAGGQGAPLVPIGDKFLFHKETSAFLNIGGFANCSYSHHEKIVAFDICPANLPLNRIAQELGFDYDKDGEISKNGEIDKNVLNSLNQLSFYKKTPPKSLGTEWLDSIFMPLLSTIKSPTNQLATATEHIAIQISKILNQITVSKIYLSGGGTKNSFLIERIQNYTNKELIIPSNEIINFKEAIIFGFLGALYIAKKNNILSSVTGAKKDTIGGVLHVP